MYVYDVIAMAFIGMSHFLLYFRLIRYDRISLPMIIVISLVFSILLGTIITVTGYPELNTILMGLFLLSLGLMQIELSFWQNLYFTMANMVSITLLKIVLLELTVFIYDWSPFNLYIWTGNLLHMIVTILIFMAILLLRKQIERFAQYIVTSPLYYVSYAILAISLIIIFLLTMPRLNFLFRIYQEYGELMYTSTFILFFILLIILIMNSHLTKEKLVQQQQENLDDELLAYVNKLELLHDELANFRHDYVNLLLTLDDGIRTGNISQIEKTYTNVITPTLGIINNHELDIVKLAHIKQSEIKSLLSVKIFEAKQHKIQVTIDIPQKIVMESMSLLDFIRIISILLDNGIDAALNSDEQSLQVAFFECDTEIYFIVGNSITDTAINLQTIFDKHYSTKSSQGGYGLYSLQHLVDQIPHATLETRIDRPYFIQAFSLKKRI